MARPLTSPAARWGGRLCAGRLAHSAIHVHVPALWHWPLARCTGARREFTDIHAGRSRARGFVTFHLDDLLPFVRFELTNLYFTLVH